MTSETTNNEINKREMSTGTSGTVSLADLLGVGQGLGNSSEEEEDAFADAQQVGLEDVLDTRTAYVLARDVKHTDVIAVAEGKTDRAIARINASKHMPNFAAGDAAGFVLRDTKPLWLGANPTGLRQCNVIVGTEDMPDVQGELIFVWKGDRGAELHYMMDYKVPVYTYVAEAALLASMGANAAGFYMSLNPTMRGLGMTGTHGTYALGTPATEAMLVSQVTAATASGAAVKYHKVVKQAVGQPDTIKVAVVGSARTVKLFPVVATTSRTVYFAGEIGEEDFEEGGKGHRFCRKELGCGDIEATSAAEFRHQAVRVRLQVSVSKIEEQMRIIRRVEAVSKFKVPDKILVAGSKSKMRILLPNVKVGGARGAAATTQAEMEQAAENFNVAAQATREQAATLAEQIAAAQQAAEERAAAQAGALEAMRGQLTAALDETHNMVRRELKAVGKSQLGVVQLQQEAGQQMAGVQEAQRLAAETAYMANHAVGRLAGTAGSLVDQLRAGGSPTIELAAPRVLEFADSPVANVQQRLQNELNVDMAALDDAADVAAADAAVAEAAAVSAMAGGVAADAVAAALAEIAAELAEIAAEAAGSAPEPEDEENVRVVRQKRGETYDDVEIEDLGELGEEEDEEMRAARPAGGYVLYSNSRSYDEGLQAGEEGARARGGEGGVCGRAAWGAGARARHVGAAWACLGWAGRRPPREG